jgi:hypothetical protein
VSSFSLDLCCVSSAALRWTCVEIFRCEVVGVILLLRSAVVGAMNLARARTETCHLSVRHTLATLANSFVELRAWMGNTPSVRRVAVVVVAADSRYFAPKCACKQSLGVVLQSAQRQYYAL